MSQIDSAAATSAQVVRILLTYNPYLEVIILLSVALPWNMDCELPPQTAATHRGPGRMGRAFLELCKKV